MTSPSLPITPSSWNSYSDRESYTHHSVHQTLIGKSVYEHGDPPMLAVLATTSPIFRNSSLGPNLLSLIGLGDILSEDILTVLFSEIFFACDSSSSSCT